MKWTGIGKGKGWIDAAVNTRSIFYHKILTKRKTVDQAPPSRIGISNNIN